MKLNSLKLGRKHPWEGEGGSGLYKKEPFFKLKRDNAFVCFLSFYQCACMLFTALQKLI